MPPTIRQTDHWALRLYGELCRKLGKTASGACRCASLPFMESVAVTEMLSTNPFLPRLMLDPAYALEVLPQFFEHAVRFQLEEIVHGDAHDDQQQMRV